MTSKIDGINKGDTVKVSWEDGVVAYTATFEVSEIRRYDTAPYLPRLGYENAHGRGFYVIGDDYEVEVVEKAKRISVGDRVERVEVAEDDGLRITTIVEFEVNHIDGATGFISGKYGRSFSPVGFTVVDVDT